MKKTIIAGAAASAVLAAMPVLGVFAEDGTLSQTDTVKVTISTACSLATSATGEYTKDMTNGTNGTIPGSTFTITCNDKGGWQLAAKGAGMSTKGATYMQASGANVNAEDDIATGDDVESLGEGNFTSSAWALKVSGNTETSVQNSYDNFKAIPDGTGNDGAGTVVAKNAGTNVTTKTATVTATYGVKISSTQAAGTYTGKVTYTLIHPATQN